MIFWTKNGCIMGWSVCFLSIGVIVLVFMLAHSIHSQTQERKRLFMEQNEVYDLQCKWGKKKGDENKKKT